MFLHVSQQSSCSHFTTTQAFRSGYALSPFTDFKPDLLWLIMAGTPVYIANCLDK